MTAFKFASFAMIFLAVTGCQVLKPNAIPNHKQHIATELLGTDHGPPIEIGEPNAFVDTVGWVVGIPDKILLWDRRVDRHKISEDTILATANYMEHNNLPHVKVRANQYAPVDDWKRLTMNKTVAWPWRYSLGALSVAGETLLPGRIFGGDHFNPYTQTIHLYSDIPAIALHEAAHAKDFTRRNYQGTYAAAYLFAPIYHETIATEDVFAYLEEQQDTERIAEANRILYPAYGTYVGNAIGGFAPAAGLPIYYASVVAGHINGRMLSKDLPTPPLRESNVIELAIDPEETAVKQVSASEALPEEAP
ncbi:MAG: hypothetical protein AB8B91_19295 [Rubripirellula sp.]